MGAARSLARSLARTPNPARLLLPLPLPTFHGAAANSPLPPLLGRPVPVVVLSMPSMAVSIARHSLFHPAVPVAAAPRAGVKEGSAVVCRSRKNSGKNITRSHTHTHTHTHTQMPHCRRVLRRRFLHFYCSTCGRSLQGKGRRICLGSKRPLP